jgi:hypothetical protein
MPMRAAKLLALAAMSFTIFSWLPARTAQAQPVQTVRYDLPTAPLHIFNLGILLDFFFTADPAQVVKTRFHLVFDAQTAAGNFPAQDLALRLEPPIPSPVPGSPDLLNVTFTGGADFGWSGSTGTFTFDGETDALDGVAIPAPKGSSSLLYLVEIFNARRIADPGDLTPLGGQFVDSWIEVDFVLIPEPSTLAGSLALAAIVGMRRRHGG